MKTRQWVKSGDNSTHDPLSQVT